MSDCADHETFELVTLNGDTVTVGRTITLAQRRAAGDQLDRHAPHLTVIQRIAVVDAMAFWFGETGDDELAVALAQAVCQDSEGARQVASVLSDEQGNA